MRNARPNTENSRPAKRKKSSADVAEEAENSNGKTNQPTRALRACDACRKQKTRCFKTSPAAVCCIRCLSVGAQCSFEVAFKSANPGVKVVNGMPEHLAGKLAVNIVSGGHDGYAQANYTYGDSRTEKKLDFLCGSVSRILEMLQTGTGAVHSPSQSILNSDVKLLLEAASSMKEGNTPELQPTLRGSSEALTAVSDELTNSPDEESPLIVLGPSRSFFVSPFSVVADKMAAVSRPILNLMKHKASSGPPAMVLSESDIIDEEILTLPEVIDLMNDFRSNYGRWVLFPSDMSTKELVQTVRKRSSLLITTCCCLSLRYSLNGPPNPGDVDSHRRKRQTYKLLIRHLLRDLNKVWLKLGCFQGCDDSKGDIETLQAMVILSIYSMSLSSIACCTVDDDPLLEDELNIKKLNLDSWYISGSALTSFISKSNFGTLLQKPEEETPNFTFLFSQRATTEYQTLTMYRIYNHLILNHLASCIFSGRMCIVDQIRISHCNLALSLPSATNFDGRMVSEIGILLIAYNYIQLSTNCVTSSDIELVEMSYKAVQEEIKSWYEQWEYLFTQPAISFVEVTQSFCCILVNLSYTYEKMIVVHKRPRLTTLDMQDRLLGVLCDCDRKRLRQIIGSAYYLVEFTILIDDDSYYAYLSDQIHFFFYFGCVVLLNALSYLKSNEKLYYLNDLKDHEDLRELTWKVALVKSTKFAERLTRICQDNPDDLLTSYRDSLIQILQKDFPIEAQLSETN